MSAPAHSPSMRAHALWTRYMAHRFAVLFFTLLLSMAAIPALQYIGVGAGVARLAFAFSLVSAIPTLESRRSRATMLCVITLAVGVYAIAARYREDGSSSVIQTLWAVLGLLAAANALRHAFNPETPGDERLYAVLATYLLAAIYFAILHSLVEHLLPGSYAIQGTPLRGEFALPDAVYFSFVTIATLGYGDIVPLSAPGRGIVILEAVGGQLYIAALVASLVGASMPKRRSRDD